MVNLRTLDPQDKGSNLIAKVKCFETKPSCNLLLHPADPLLSMADGHPLLGLLSLKLLLFLLLLPQLLDGVQHRLEVRAFDLVLYPFDPLLNDVFLFFHLLDVLPQLARGVARVLERLQLLVDRLERVNQLFVL